MEDIPNKIQSGLDIIADVNKHTKDGKDYLEIKVDPSSFPISYHGEFHYRSGATKQQLTGIALTEFITKKTGIRVYFPALRSALMYQSNTPKGHSAKNDGTLDDTMAYKIIEVIRSKPDITLDQLSTETGIARRTLVRYMSALK